MKKLYAIRDRLAMALLGSHIHVMAHDTVAMRFFGDVLAAPDTHINRHAADHELVCLGSIKDDGTLGSEQDDEMLGVSYVPRIVMTGAQWQAAQVVRE